MPTATRIPSDMNGWAPVSRHYAVDGGHLVVTVNKWLTAEGTDVFYADSQGAAISMTAIAQYPEGTTHDEALEQLGYTVVDEIGPEPVPEPVPETAQIVESVLDMLPPEIAAVIAAANEGETA